MKNGLVIIATIFLFVAGNVTAQNVVGITFISSLSQGDSGPAVLSLQKLLNNDSDTKIANFGVGSPGFETNYFGFLPKMPLFVFRKNIKARC